MEGERRPPGGNLGPVAEFASVTSQDKGSHHGDQADPVLREPREDVLPPSMGHSLKVETRLQSQGSTQKGAGRIPGATEEPRPW